MADRPHVAAQHGNRPVNGHRRPAQDDGRLLGRGDEPDPADERTADFRPVECERCGAAPLVAKFSPRHTSVQWTLASVRACAEFSARAAAGQQTALIDTCASLRNSIDRAVLQGRLEVSSP
ncbi:MAG TPA: hypothetical protein VH307_29275 [Streptosporangiaceae bacterium]|jgi:hypothetical protein|nr:hypothetical protein [Streptosporangiaceae bacterium]